MGSRAAGSKSHVVCVPYPAQGHVTPMLSLAKLLHSHGFHTTFVNTKFNHDRLVRWRGPSAVQGLDDFVFETIPDGLPPSDPNATQDIPALSHAITHHFLDPFRGLLRRLNDPSSSTPPVTCIVGDGAMSFTLDAAEEIGVPLVTLWTSSVCGFAGCLHCQDLVDKGLVPLKDMADVSNGYLDTPIDVPGLKNMRMRDLPSFIRTTDPEDIMLKFMTRELQRDLRANAILFNTFDDLDRPILDALAPRLPPFYNVGPLALLSCQINASPMASISSSLWKEEMECLHWLEGKEASSVVYVNFGSITTMMSEQLVEFAWGLANSNYDFLWVIRSDLVADESAILPPEFIEGTKGRGFMANWCPQQEVLAHRGIGGFLTHCGWNSMLDSMSSGVPMLCWPFFAEQQTNCRYAQTEWGVGMEIESKVKREEVEGLISELMRGEKGKEMRRRALAYKEGAVRATVPGGSSFVSFEMVVKELMLRPKNE